MLHICFLLAHPEEIAQLFSEHYEQLHRYAFTILKDGDTAKDIVQAIFLNLWEKRASLNINTSPKAYLFRCVYNESLNYLKKQDTLKKHHFSATAGVMQDEQKPFAWEDDLLLKARIEGALNNLPPQCREVFVKSRAEEKKYSEIASELNISVKTVEAHMSKALRLIRQVVRVFIWFICPLTL